ncbi:MAG: DUF1800 domain-containing protein [Crocinitomicaceae bacterium]|nr:DUF1800 domain-containing protein [Crocinitomicaceae bacterium]
MPDQGQGPGVSLSMTPYSGPWTKAEAAHLLRRTTFGSTNQQILDAVTNGMPATVTSLLTLPPATQPLTYLAEETIAAQGTTWVNSVYPANPTDAQSVETARILSLAGWLMQRLNTEQLSIAEKMTLFWQNHFSANVGADARAAYEYFNKLYNASLGNFKQLVKDITIDPNMLLFLNGATNTLYSPNENYARELLELFTIGKGPQIGPGDYTNYTEEDVAAGAKILTGYIVNGLRSDTLTSVTATFTPILHDTSSKTLSGHFGNAVITDNGANEYADYIDVIFQQDEVAHFICRKLYRYFVNYDLTTLVESTVISEMATTLIANNYDVLPVLVELFSSEHFYDISVRGALIKSPLEMIYSMMNSTESVPNYDLATNYEMEVTMYWFAENMGQAYAEPPSVAGWPAYYQEPSYSKLWVNATHVKSRFDLSSWMTLYNGIPANGNNWKVNTLTFLDNLSLPADAPTVIDDICDVFSPKGVDAVQKLILKAILTNSLPDFEWTLQYNEYLANPGNTVYSDPVKQRVELVLGRFFQMPEFHTA